MAETPDEILRALADLERLAIAGSLARALVRDGRRAPGRETRDVPTLRGEPEVIQPEDRAPPPAG